MNNDAHRSQLIAVGKELFSRGLQTTRSGNLSVRDGDRFIITQTGANLGHLSDSNFLSVGLADHSPIPPGASCETPLHRAIYLATDALAIVHAHPIHAIALAQVAAADRILPIHNEGLAGLKCIPIVETTVPGKDTGEVPDAIVAAFSQSCAVVVRGHGAFTVGASLDQACYKMMLLEDSCRINLLVLEHSRAAAAPVMLAVPKSPRRAGARRFAGSD
jgi:L-fuculose-phosphate aldolase